MSKYIIFIQELQVKIIPYIPRTGASSRYREIAPEHTEWLMSQWALWLSRMGQMDALRDTDSRWVREQWWHHRDPQLCRGESGPNSPCSLVSGLLYNFMFKEPPQRDLTEPQMRDIERISHVLAQVYPDCLAVRFRIGLTNE